MTFPKPKREDYEEYLIWIYFGGDDLKACINRAYRDLNRTLHGISKIKQKDELHKKAVDMLITLFERIKSKEFNNNADFDKWHRKACEKLSMLYKKYGFSKFAIGQAQKWINMTFKYIFTMGSERLSGYSKHYKYSHVPLDNIILEQFDKFDCPDVSNYWSRIDDYDEYFNFQKWIRKSFKGSIPLSVEFNLWMNSD